MEKKRAWEKRSVEARNHTQKGLKGKKTASHAKKAERGKILRTNTRNKYELWDVPK